jgi:enoyl-CoA hydratase/carnithine racemase
MSSIVVTNHTSWAHIRIDRADKRNALNQAARLDLLAALKFLAGKTSAVVITGSDQWFCCGADVKERAQRVAEGKPDTAGQEGIDLAMAVRNFPGVVIAAVNGLALGYGVNLINCCDLALAAGQAKLGLPELRASSFASMSAATSRLSGLNPKRLGWLVFNTEPIEADTALSWGLVNEVVPAGQLAERAQEIAAKIAEFDLATLVETKAALAKLSEINGDWRDAMDYGQIAGARIKGLSAGK